jgi:hypothetical protein
MRLCHTGVLRMPRCPVRRSVSRVRTATASPYLPGVRSGLSLAAAAGAPWTEPLAGVFGLPCCRLSGVVGSAAGGAPEDAVRWGLPLWLGLLQAPAFQ